MYQSMFDVTAHVCLHVWVVYPKSRRVCLGSGCVVGSACVMNVEHRADEKRFDVHLHRCQRQSSKCILLFIQKQRWRERVTQRGVKVAINPTQLKGIKEGKKLSKEHIWRCKQSTGEYAKIQTYIWNLMCLKKKKCGFRTGKSQLSEAWHNKHTHTFTKWEYSIDSFTVPLTLCI